jgi:hypothetical protein
MNSFLGIKAGQVQVPEWFGPDCSKSISNICSVLLFCSDLLIVFFFSSLSSLPSNFKTGHCPSADNPFTVKDETDCLDVPHPLSQQLGLTENLCQVDCANLGTCDYESGTCRCFPGSFGEACQYSEIYRPPNNTRLVTMQS